MHSTHLIHLGDDAVMCIDAGEQQPLRSDFQQDLYFVGGDVLRTEEGIVEKEGPLVYQTARFGNFSYIIGDLPAGDYFADLHFAEIVFTNGLAGMRVFDVFVQEDKVRLLKSTVTCITISSMIPHFG